MPGPQPPMLSFIERQKLTRIEDASTNGDITRSLSVIAHHLREQTQTVQQWSEENLDKLFFQAFPLFDQIGSAIADPYITEKTSKVGFFIGVSADLNAYFGEPTDVRSLCSAHLSEKWRVPIPLITIKETMPLVTATVDRETLSRLDVSYALFCQTIFTRQPDSDAVKDQLLQAADELDTAVLHRQEKLPLGDRVVTESAHRPGADIERIGPGSERSGRARCRYIPRRDGR
jgi:hypothetical protein